MICYQMFAFYAFSLVLIMVYQKTLADCTAGGKNDSRRLQHAIRGLASSIQRLAALPCVVAMDGE